MDGTIGDVYNKEVQRWRTGAAMTWAVITVPIIFGVYVTLANVDIFHLSQWISDSLSMMFSVYYVLVCFVVAMVTELWCCLSLPTFTVEPEVHHNPIHLALYVCSPRRLGFGLVCFLLSGATSIICTGVLMGRYQDLMTCTNRSELPVDSLYGLLDVGLLWQCLLFGWLIHVSWTLSSLLIKVYITERFCFPVESLLDDRKNQCLIDALQCDQNTMVKFLGFLDLCLLSKHSPQRRQTVFSLSQPGGHPHNWTKLSTACLAVITSLSERIQDANWQVFSEASVRPAPDDIRKPPGNHHGSVLTYRGDNVTKETAPPQPTKDVWSFWRSKPVISYLLTEFPDAKSRKLFTSAQVDIWAVEALCNLVAASFVEDKYGVVQKSLPQILTSVINLQENVEKHLKLASSGRRNGAQGPLDLPLKYVLHSSLKACIYRIINTFGVHLLNLDLPSDTSYKLRLFMDFKE
ncbi:nucleoporin NDC1-like isoform X2 [Ostrea edulis]|uniref:nucleoporin NDC1-like isoform X2 n=1 Tax=Ostrea edulis TaxID=37623 RepID=UPI0024AEEB3B|nr:nucleoporin NDC1-like isoform X2 [Ostrea edulis]